MNNISRKYDLKWTIDAHTPTGGSIRNPDWKQIRDKLDTLEICKDGTVVLNLNNGRPDWKELSVQGEGGYYFILFNDNMDDKTVFRRSFDSGAKIGKRSIGGYDWDSRTTFEDYEFVYQVFEEYFRTGNVVSPRLYPRIA